MTGLVRRSSGPVFHGLPGDETGSRNLADADWGGAPIQIDALGVALPTNLGARVASAVTTDPRVRRRGTRHYRLRIGWLAGAQGVVVVRLEQDLLALPDGRFRAQGAYRHAETETYLAVETPGRRVGDVPMDASRAVDAELGGTHEPALDEIAFLPAKVRRSFVGRVRSPRYFSAEALEWNGGQRHTVSGLRLDDREACVVQAAHHRDTTHWVVELVTYRLRADRAQLAHPGWTG